MSRLYAGVVGLFYSQQLTPLRYPHLPRGIARTLTSAVSVCACFRRAHSLQKGTHQATVCLCAAVKPLIAKVQPYLDQAHPYLAQAWAHIEPHHRQATGHVNALFHGYEPWQVVAIGAAATLILMKVVSRLFS